MRISCQLEHNWCLFPSDACPAPSHGHEQLTWNTKLATNGVVQDSHCIMTLASSCQHRTLISASSWRPPQGPASSHGHEQLTWNTKPATNGIVQDSHHIMTIAAAVDTEHLSLQAFGGSSKQQVVLQTVKTKLNNKVIGLKKTMMSCSMISKCTSKEFRQEK